MVTATPPRRVEAGDIVMVVGSERRNHAMLGMDQRNHAMLGMDQRNHAMLGRLAGSPPVSFRVEAGDIVMVVEWHRHGGGVGKTKPYHA